MILLTFDPRTLCGPIIQLTVASLLHPFIHPCLLHLNLCPQQHLVQALVYHPYRAFHLPPNLMELYFDHRSRVNLPDRLVEVLQLVAIPLPLAVDSHLSQAAVQSAHLMATLPLLLPHLIVSLHSQ